MDLEEMKRQWSGLNARVDNIESSINRQRLDSMKTAQQQLVSRYRRFAMIAASFIMVSAMLFPRLPGNMWLTAGFVIYFVICTIMELIMQRKVAAIDLNNMPVVEVSNTAISCRRLHHIFQLILIPLAVIVIGAFAITMSDDVYLLYGIGAGAAVGLVFGLKEYFRFMDDYKNLIKQSGE